MPIYEYECSECGKVSEIMVGIGAQSDALQCKYCSSTTLNKILSFTSIATTSSRPRGRTCCGREERCDTAPCSTGDICRRDQ
jgi:putative FmdB family regulatory protein